MKNKLLLLFFSFFISVYSFAQEPFMQAEGVIANGEKAPPFELKDVEGKTLSWEALKGKVVFVNFFFVQCPPCLFEVAMIQEMADHYKGKDVAFVAISIADSTHKLKAWREYYENVEYPEMLASASFQSKSQAYKDEFRPEKMDWMPRYENQLLIPGDVQGPKDESGRVRAVTWWLAKEFGVSTYPTCFIIDQNGKVAMSKDGYTFNKEKKDYDKEGDKKMYMEVINHLLKR